MILQNHAIFNNILTFYQNDFTMLVNIRNVEKFITTVDATDDTILPATF